MRAARSLRAGFVPAGRMSRFLNVLRSWLVMVSVIAAGNTLQSFRDHSFLSEKLYTASPGLGKGRAGRPEAWRWPSSRWPWGRLGPAPQRRLSSPRAARCPGVHLPGGDGGVASGAVRGLHVLPPSLRSERAPGSDLWRLDPAVISDPLSLRHRHPQ